MTRTLQQDAAIQEAIQAIADMAGLTGSVTLHFKDGIIQKVEYRTFRQPAGKQKAA